VRVGCTPMNISWQFRRATIVALALVAAMQRGHAQDTTRVTRIDFQDADLRAVITAIAEAGGLNVTYGEIPARRLTLHLPQSPSRAEMPALLRNVAASNGLRVVADGTLLRVESIDVRDAATRDPAAR